LILQAMLLAPITERLCREASIGAGRPVLDIRFGLGDVSMIAARTLPAGTTAGRYTQERGSSATTT
jgi:hypothetical protein